MADEHCNLQSICWSETFPFVRLFATFKRAISFWSLMLGFSCVLSTYVAGRVLDVIWKAADGGVLVAAGGVGEPSGAGLARGIPVVRSETSEIGAYARLDTRAFEAWVRERKEEWETRQAEQGDAEATPDAEQVSQMLALVDERVEKGLASIDSDTETTSEDKQRARDELPRAADVIRLGMAGYDESCLGAPPSEASALATVLGADPEVDSQQVSEEHARLRSLLAQCQRQADRERLQPRGPFISLLDYEMDCFSAAIQGVCKGRWGLSGSALSSEPAMIGSIASAGSGVLWLVTQRPWFTVVFAIVLLLIFALFGGAICRVAAVRSTREESTSYMTALRFSREKLGGSVAAPLLPTGAFVIAGVCIFVGGLVAAIWGLHVIAGVLYGLTLLGGVVLAFTLLAVVLGFHLMWPTIAVEGSDAFDAVQRAAGYVFGRPWHTAFYSFVLLLYGGVSFVMVRIIAMLVLKLSHVFTGAGMNLASSAQTSTIGKLDAIWHMPAWQDLPLLPAVGDVNFWGSFGNAPLSGAESFTMFFMALWVFLMVGMVGAFVVSFYFCGSTEMYLLLRRVVDAVDYDEIYYEELEDEFDEEGQPEAGEPEPAEEPAESAEREEAGEPEESAKPERRPRPRTPKAAEKPEDEGAKPPDDGSSSSG
ncbi:MAG: hypothetical protein KKI02_12370 [Planctomycetes bacterium]|nr:hypothetical protein [Planctomycetota bacterium]